jgi:hypothetical protein
LGDCFLGITPPTGRKDNKNDPPFRVDGSVSFGVRSGMGIALSEELLRPLSLISQETEERYRIAAFSTLGNYRVDVDLSLHILNMNYSTSF